jgi:hypothetical protein
MIDSPEILTFVSNSRTGHDVKGLHYLAVFDRVVQTTSRQLARITRPIPNLAQEWVLRWCVGLVIHMGALDVVNSSAIAEAVLEEICTVPTRGGVQSVLVRIKVIGGTL